MKNLILFSSLLVLLSTACNKKELIRPKGSDTQWQQRQEQEEQHRRLETEQQRQQQQQYKDLSREDINLTPANN